MYKLKADSTPGQKLRLTACYTPNCSLYNVLWWRHRCQQDDIQRKLDSAGVISALKMPEGSFCLSTYFLQLVRTTLSLQAGNDDFIRNHACWHPDLHTPQPFGSWKASCCGRLVGGRADAGSGHFGDMLGLGSRTRGQELLQRLLLRSTVKPYLTLPDLSAPVASSSAEELHRMTFEILLYSVTPSFCHSLCRTSSQPFSKPQIKTNKWHWKETEKGKGLLFASFKQEDFMPSKPHSAVLH